MRYANIMMRKVHFSRQGLSNHLGHLILVLLFDRCSHGLFSRVGITLSSAAHHAELRSEVIACRETERDRLIQDA